MSAALGSLGQAMYVATKEDSLWLQNVQRALHTRSKEHLGYVFEKLWGPGDRPPELPNRLRPRAAKLRRADGGHRPGHGQAGPAERSDAVPRRDPQGLARGHVPAGSRPARTHSESRPTGEVSSPGHPDRERRQAWQKAPSFVATSTESPMRNERRTPGSVRGARKPTRR